MFVLCLLVSLCGAYDIKILFLSLCGIDTGGKESSRSIVGKKAQDQHQDNPTMWLNLSSGGDNYKKHVVIHEFGHALGLGHEHQRSDFWKIVKPYVNVGAIISEVGKASFDVNWGKDHEYNKKNATKYDPLSVMHYS